MKHFSPSFGRPALFGVAFALAALLTVLASPAFSQSPEQTLFGASVPATVTENDSNAVELGVKFPSAVPGQIRGTRFYKGPQNLGTHTGSLWNTAGTRLATATFSGETASGWQEVRFAAPVTITANTTYVASYYAPQGKFFPNETFNATNYWVDVVFSTSPAPTATFTAEPAAIAAGQSATLTWSATNAASCTGTGFATGDATSGSAAVSPTATTTNTLTCTGAGGTITKSVTVTVTVPDTSAPTIPTGLKVVPVATDENIVLWKVAEDDTDVEGYDIYRNGTKIASTQFVTYYNDKGLTANTSYTYAVRAFDAAGNTSAQTAGVAATTHPNGSNVVVGDPSNPAALQQAIVDAYNAGAKSVTINAGTYVIPSAGALASLALVDMHDFVVNGYGVTISGVENPSGVFGTFWCRNMVIRGLDIRYETPNFTQGEIVGLGQSGNQYYLDVQLEPGYRQSPVGDGDAYDRSFGFVYDVAQQKWKNTVMMQSTKWQSLGNGKWRLYYPGQLAWQNAVIGDRMAFRGGGASVLNPWATFDGIYQDITTRNHGVFGVREERSGRNHYFGLKVTYMPKPAGATHDPLLSGNVDGFRSISAEGGSDIQNSLIEGSGDDAIAMMGFYNTVVSASGNTLTVTPDEISEEGYPSFRVGDPVRVVGTRGYYEKAIVTATAMSGSNVLLTLDRPLAAQPGDQAANPNQVGSNYQLIRNTVRNNVARGIVPRGSDGKILNNTIDGSTVAGILLGAPGNDFGGESDYGWNVLVSNNTVKKTGFGTNYGDAKGHGIELKSDVTPSGFRGHRNITFRNNTFDHIYGLNMFVSYSTDITIKNNRFLNPHQDPIDDASVDTYLIKLNECTGVTIDGNTVVNPGPYHTGLVSTNTNCQNVTTDW